MATFKCLNCGRIKSISKFRTIYKNNKIINIDLEYNKEILCENCKTILEFIPNEGKFYSSYSSFSTLSPLEKQKLLRKRSDNDAKKMKYREQEREKEYFNA